VRGGACGSVTFIQRFGSALNLTPHFHALVLDGVYEGSARAPGRFRPLDPPETDDVARVLAGTARRIRRRLEAPGNEEGEDRLAEDEPLLAMLAAASIRSRIATGPEAGAPWRRLGDRVRRDEPARGRGGPGTGPPATRAPLPLRGTSASGSRTPRGAEGRPARLSVEDAVARWNDARRDGADGAARAAGAAGSASPSASGSIPRGARPVCEWAGSGSAGRDKRRARSGRQRRAIDGWLRRSDPRSGRGSEGKVEP
jgi:hypothetical protein